MSEPGGRAGGEGTSGGGDDGSGGDGAPVFRLGLVPDADSAGVGPGDPSGTAPDDGGAGGAAPGAETFRVRCPDCGPQVVPMSTVRYVETGTGPADNRYTFTCPECGTKVRRPAGPELAEILRSSGVATLALHRGTGEAV